MPRMYNNPYIIPGKKAGARLINLQKPWREIRLRANLPDYHIHDLRHSFASMAVGVGMSLPMIGKLLGHTQPATTARYAHLATDPIRAASNLVGSEIITAMTIGKPTPKRVRARLDPALRHGRSTRKRSAAASDDLVTRSDARS